MSTIKLTVNPRPWKDGTCPVRITVSHRCQTQHIPTPIRLNSPSQLRNGVIIGHPNAAHLNLRLLRRLNTYNEALDELTNSDTYSCSQLRRWLMMYRRGACAVTLEEEADHYIASLKKQRRDGYAEIIGRTVRRWQAVVGKDITLESITPMMLEDFTLDLSQTLSPATVGIHLRNIRTLVNKAKREGRVSYRIEPFVSTRIPSGSPRDLSISTDELRRLRDAEIPSYRERISRDLFMLSFYLGGANLRDILEYNYRHTDVFDYRRHKTRNMKRGESRVVISIQPEARAIIDKYMNRDSGKLSFHYKFGYENFKRYVTRMLRRIGEGIGIQRLVFYSARHTFGQHCFDLGISLEIAEYCMGQSVKGNRPIYNYVRIMRRHGDEAIRKVLDEIK